LGTKGDGRKLIEREGGESARGKRREGRWEGGQEWVVL